jgi:hypothetical protein
MTMNLIRLAMAAPLFLALASTPTGERMTPPVSPGTSRPEAPPVRPPQAGKVIRVGADGDFTAALRQAQPGDVIELQAGAVFEGPFSLPRKSGEGWIRIRTSAPDSALPPPGTRMSPSFSAKLPKLEARGGSVLTAVGGAHHYEFIGIEIRPKAGAFLYNLVDLGGPARFESDLPHHIVFSRCYIHGDPDVGGRRGIAMNSGNTEVVDSYLSDFKEVGADSQAIAGWGGTGPYRIVNNYLEAAGENIMFGGADPAIDGLVPSDIEIRRNRIAKPLSWRAKDGDTASVKKWTIKNLLELKNARRVRIDGNVLENSWGQSQDGFAVLFTVRNQDGKAPWSEVSDVVFTNNIVWHAASGIYLLGRDNSGGASGQLARVLIRNNLFYDIDGATWNGKGTLFQIINGTASVTIEQNTGLQSGNIITAEGPAHEQFAFRANLVLHNHYGITGTGTGVGLSTLKALFPGADVSGNVIVGGQRELYPPSNQFPSTLEAAGIRKVSGAEEGLVGRGLFAPPGHDGRPIGVDPKTLLEAVGMSTFSTPAAGNDGRYLIRTNPEG